MYIRLIDSTFRENENLFRLNDQQKVYYYRRETSKMFRDSSAILF